jgi:hypothetical protein
VPTDGDIDYRSLTREQLGEALSNIDAPQFPKNYQRLIAEIAARDGGRAQEPPPDDPRLVVAENFWGDVVLGGIVGLYGIVAFIAGRLYLPALSGRLRHIDGSAARLGSVAILVIAIAIVLGGLDDSDPPRISARFRWAFRLAAIVLMVAPLASLIST